MVDEHKSRNRERDSQLEVQVTAHAKAVADLDPTHERAVLDLKSQHAKAIDDLKSSHEVAMAELEQKHGETIVALGQEQEALVEEMENSLSASEEQRRQLKIKADQASFEISRVRDETTVQRKTTAKQLAEVQRNNAVLEQARAELQEKNAELARRLSELDHRPSLKSSPPQGPPPNTPLPPLPGQFSLLMIKDLSSEGTMSHSTHRSNGSHGSTLTAPTSLDNDAHLSEHEKVQKVVAERDAALASKRELLYQLESAKEAVSCAGQDQAEGRKQERWRSRSELKI